MKFYEIVQNIENFSKANMKITSKKLKCKIWYNKEHLFTYFVKIVQISVEITK